MTKKLLLTVVLVSVTGTSAFGQRERRHVPRPRVMARQCAYDIRHMTHATIREMHARANRCVVAIGELLEEDKVEDAQRLAGRCSQEINEQVDNGVRRITGRAGRCLTALTELDASDRLKALIPS